MSVSGFESNHEVVASIEGEELLRLTREGIIQLAYSRLDDAMELEAEGEHVYFSHVATDAPDEEALVIMLTKDGVRPFQEELNDKEQIILYFPPSTIETIWVDHIRDGDSDRFTLDSHALSYQATISDEVSSEPEIEPTVEDFEKLEMPQKPLSDMARLSVLREKIERFLLTPFS